MKVPQKVTKLLKKNRQFIVIGEHEPYYLEAYMMIRRQEQTQGTWTLGDEDNFQDAVDRRYNIERL